MCRSIKPLFNFDPPPTEDEVHDAALQFVRKLSGFRSPSKVNERIFNQTVDDISQTTSHLLSHLKTDAKPKNRDVETAKKRARYATPNN